MNVPAAGPTAARDFEALHGWIDDPTFMAAVTLAGHGQVDLTTCTGSGTTRHLTAWCTDSRTRRQVTLTASSHSCTCPDGRVPGRPCPHVAAVALIDLSSTAGRSVPDLTAAWLARPAAVRVAAVRVGDWDDDFDGDEEDDSAEGEYAEETGTEPGWADLGEAGQLAVRAFITSLDAAAARGLLEALARDVPVVAQVLDSLTAP